MTTPHRQPPLKLAELHRWIGQETGVSKWIVVDQKRIDDFAATTGDRQFIHVDPVRAANSSFGTTIAHGLLTLSLMGEMKDVFPEISDLEMGVNYGFDRVRFLAPVKSGASIRARCKLVEMKERAPNNWLCRYLVTIEIQDSDQPAMVADWLILNVARPSS
ncbi:MAG: MaoC family dehydratase [Xanthobacteraceae bacterium]